MCKSPQNLLLQPQSPLLSLQQWGKDLDFPMGAEEMLNMGCHCQLAESSAAELKKGWLKRVSPVGSEFYKKFFMESDRKSRVYFTGEDT
jgi:hypothetical protein